MPLWSLDSTFGKQKSNANVLILIKQGNSIIESNLGCRGDSVLSTFHISEIESEVAQVVSDSAIPWT